MKSRNLSENWGLISDNGSVVQELNKPIDAMYGLLENPSQPITITNKIVTCSASVLVFITAVVSIRIISKSPLLPVNRHFLLSVFFSDLLQVRLVTYG